MLRKLNTEMSAKQSPLKTQMSSPLSKASAHAKTAASPKPSGPSKSEPSKSEPSKFETSKSVTSKSELSKAELSKAEPPKAKPLSKPGARRRYDDDEAGCSDSDVSEDEEEEANEYDMSDSMMKGDEEEDSEGDEDAVAALRTKQALEGPEALGTKRFKVSAAKYKKPEAKAEAQKSLKDGKAKKASIFEGDSEEEEPLKMASGNKHHHNFRVPEQPLPEQAEILPKNMRWCLRLDPKSFRRAVRPALKALPMCFFRFNIVETDGEINAGLTIQAFDNPATMGYYSRVRVILIPGVDDSGKKLTLKDLHDSNFGLSSKNLETVIVVASASNPSATLQFMMFNPGGPENYSPDKLVVKSVADGSTMMSTFEVNLLKKASTDSPIPALMQRAAKEKEENKRLVFRITAQLLRQQGDVAKRIGSEDLRFDVFKGVSKGAEDGIKYRLSVIWSGAEIQGQQDSFVGTVVSFA